METLFSLLVLAGMGCAAFYGLKWMLRSGRGQTRKPEQLTPSDLKLLEESANRLMADLRAVTDECIARIESACQAAEEIMIPRGDHGAEPTEPQRRSIFDMIDASEPMSHIAREAGMTTGEVELLRGLRSCAPRVDYTPSTCRT